MVVTSVKNSESELVVALPYGAYSQIARRLRPPVKPQVVWAVAKGERKSARISRAIATYVARLSKQQAAA